MISFIVNVKLDSLVHLGKLLIFYKKLFVFLRIVAVMLFLSAVLSTQLVPTKRFLRKN